MSSDGQVRLSIEGARATLLLDSPSRKNAISAAMWESICGHADALSARPDIRVVVFRGGGDLFSAGADITGFDAGRSGRGGSHYDDLVEAACQAVEAIAVPTVAQVRGACIGAGLSLAAACDLRWCAEDAFFLFPAARLGLGYDRRGVARLMRVFGSGATRQLLYTAAALSADRALALGAVQAIVPRDDLETAVGALAGRIASNAPLTVRAAKLAIRSLLEPENEPLREAADASRRAADGSEDYAEGRRAFAEKRPPRFTGE